MSNQKNSPNPIQNPPNPIQNPPNPIPNSPKPITQGVIYSAVGPKYIQALIKSAKSLKKHSPKIMITAYVDHPHQINSKPKIKKLFEQVHQIPSTPQNTPQQKWGRYQKVIAMSQSPYDITLYLDVDTKIKGNITNLFNKLHLEKRKQKNNHKKNHKKNQKKNNKNNHTNNQKKNKNTLNQNTMIYDLAIANSPHLTKDVPFRLVKYKKPHRYNSGVIVYQKSENMKKVFQLWIKACQNNKQRKLDDQGYLVDILNKQTTPVNFRVLDNKKYNARHTMVTKLKIDDIYHKVKILHESL